MSDRTERILANFPADGQLVVRYRKFEDFIAEADATLDGLHHADGTVNGRWLEARRRRDTYKDQVNRPIVQPAPEVFAAECARLDAAVEVEARRRAEHGERLKSSIRHANTLSDHRKRLLDLAEKLQPEVVVYAAPKFGKADTCENLAARLVELAAESKLAAAALPPLEGRNAEIPALVASLAKPPQLTGAGGNRGALGVRPPLVAVDAEPRNPGGFANAPDALALLAWALPDKVVAALEEQLVETYRKHTERGGLILSASDRAARLAELAAEIRDAEFKIAALIWRQVDEGGAPDFPPDLPAAAILGVAL